MDSTGRSPRERPVERQVGDDWAITDNIERMRSE